MVQPFNTFTSLRVQVFIFRFLKTYINYIEKNNFLHYRMWDDIVHGHENQLTVGCVVDAMRAGE